MLSTMRKDLWKDCSAENIKKEEKKVGVAGKLHHSNRRLNCK
jgi:hypothetical protein